MKLEPKGSYSICRTGGDLTGEAINEEFKNLIQKNFNQLGNAVIVDLRDTKVVDPNFLRAVATVGKMLKDGNKQFFAINVSHNVLNIIRTNGLDNTIKIMPLLADVLSTFRASGPKLDVNFISPFIDGALQVLEIQCQLKAKAGKPFLKGQGPVLEADIAAVIGLTSKAFTGSVAICFPEKIFLALMGNMLGSPVTEITKDLEDGAAELLNIIFSTAKSVLNDKGYAIARAIPTIVSGQALSVRHLTTETTVVLPFETDYGVFHVEVAVEQQKQAS